ncbi:putative sodium-coupled neutral amino acid transporter 8a isoform X3 [Onychostoma macrolepis]|nr:putative sodium-coupled neutral amino acid transporter 8a isoform X3 [Onychostoma macrolepis]XP_058606494.1 putative sodium-coupled neutral amino acid transporter 8a isoform X3 [Onychostoma macrolepis]XP_058606495.1 putative sodium-coupled neutral amino acid transporter 8a isoform X3 [Onychostoma macrolepis]
MEELAQESISLLTKPSLDTNGPKLGSLGAVFIMLKSALGAGLLIFPWTFEKAGGIHSAVTVEMISLVFLISGLIILGYSSSVSGQNTYQAVVRDVCGPAIGNLCEICYVFNLFFISVAFLVIVADQLQKLCVSIYELITGLPESEMPYNWYTDQRFALFLLSLFFIFPLSVPKEISIQKYTSLYLFLLSVLGTFAATYLTVAIIVKYHMRPVHEISLSPLYSSGVRSWDSMFSVIPTICFGFQCHEACVAVYSSMENRKLSHWVFISVVSMFICLIIYSLTGVFGYLTFGKNVTPDILMSYSGGDVTMIIARLLFGISIITIYPIIVLLGRSVIQDPLLRRRHKHTAVTGSYESRTRVALTTAWVTITLLIAVFVPDISKVIGVVGGVSAFFIFIFPGLCLIFVVQSESISLTMRYLLITWGMITLFCGTCIFGQSTSIAIMQLLSEI